MPQNFGKEFEEEKIDKQSRFVQDCDSSLSASDYEIIHENKFCDKENLRRNLFHEYVCSSLYSGRRRRMK